MDSSDWSAAGGAGGGSGQECPRSGGRVGAAGVAPWFDGGGVPAETPGNEDTLLGGGFGPPGCAT